MRISHTTFRKTLLTQIPLAVALILALIIGGTGAHTARGTPTGGGVRSQRTRRVRARRRGPATGPAVYITASGYTYNCADGSHFGEPCAGGVRLSNTVLARAATRTRTRVAGRRAAG